MTAIPGKASFTGASVTEGGFKTALESMHDYLTEQLGSAGGRALNHGSVRLSYSSATELLLLPHGGNRLMVKDATNWKLREIASAGLACANTGVHVNGTGSSNLAANTTYQLYVFDDGGTLRPDFSTTAAAVDSTTGVMVSSTDATRTLVGVVRTNGSSQFSAAGTRSHFNDPVAGKVPVGTIAAWPGSTPPAGALEMDGAAVSRGAYAELFALIGDDYGAGDGSTTFNIPDARGEFLRGWDHGAGNDPDAATRTDRGDGTTGDNVGTQQADELKSHRHTGPGAFTNNAASTSIPGATTTGLIDNTNTATGIALTGGDETRPRNLAVMWVIFY